MAQIPTEVVTAGIGLTGGALGYAFREYRNRVRPFMQITEIDGSVCRRTDTVKIDPSLTTAFDGTFYIKGLPKQCRFGEFYDCWDRADDIRQLHPQIQPDLDALIAASGDDDLIKALHEAFRGKFFDQWLMLLLAKNRITFPDISDTAQDEKVHIYEGDEYNGTAWCDFGFDTISFGRGLKNPALRAKVDPWLSAVRVLHQPSIRSAMQQYREILQAEYNCAMQHVDTMKTKVNKHSRWCFSCYLANLSNTPLVIETNATLTVADLGNKYREPCYIALLKRDKAGDISFSDTLKPLVLKAGSDIEFAVITKSIQGDMKLGDAIREAFDRGQGKCYLNLIIRKVGLLKRQKYRSPSMIFASTEEATK